VPTLDPHQVGDVEYLIRNPKSFLGNKPGVGKTAPSIVAASATAVKLYVGCPAVGRTHWKRQVKEWWPELEEKDLMVESHNMLAVSEKARAAARAFGADTVIIDEAHRLRGISINPHRNQYNAIPSKTSQAYYGPNTDGVGGLIERAERVWPLSGTPKPNNAGEMWAHLHALRPDLITVHRKPLTYTAFIERYTDFSWTEYGPRFWRNKPETLPELKAILQQFIRRVEGTTTLPPLNWEAVIVDPVAAKETLKALEDLEKSPSVVKLKMSLSELEAAGCAPESVNWSSSDSALAELRRVIGEIKAPTIAGIIADELRDQAYPKIVLFAHHHSVIDALYTELLEYNPVVLTGKTSPKKRQEAIDGFQEDPSVQVFIGQMIACGELITLTAADQVAFVEDSWVPDVILQCAKRLHRRGQSRPVFARMFSLANSIDEGTIRVRVRKAKMDSELLV
jgi:SNF2 family DNA or RNA helicase